MSNFLLCNFLYFRSTFVGYFQPGRDVFDVRGRLTLNPLQNLNIASSELAGNGFNPTKFATLKVRFSELGRKANEIHHASLRH
jgi:hypothetical protein